MERGKGHKLMPAKGIVLCSGKYESGKRRSTDAGKKKEKKKGDKQVPAKEIRSGEREINLCKQREYGAGKGRQTERGKGDKQVAAKEIWSEERVIN